MQAKVELNTVQVKKMKTIQSGNSMETDSDSGSVVHVHGSREKSTTSAKPAGCKEKNTSFFFCFRQN